jgi:16S rRNA processing protein RimM
MGSKSENATGTDRSPDAKGEPEDTGFASMNDRSKPKRGRPGKGRRSRASRFRQRSSSVPDGHLAVGRILGAHGLRGEVKIESHTDFDSRFDPGQQLLVGKELLLAEITSSRPHKGIFLVQFSEISDRFGAEELYNEWLYIPEEAAMELEEDSFWVHDIVGLTAQTESKGRLGEVVDVLFTGANEVYIVRPAPGVNRDRDLLIPALEEVVRRVDIEAGTLTVRLQPGLLEESGE